MVSLEWQTALNKAVNNDLKFVSIRISDCSIPVILSDKLYIDLYGVGLDSAIENMKHIVKSESTYTPLQDVENIVAIITRKNYNTLSIQIEASLYSEANPTFAFACSNTFNEFSVCFTISDGIIVSGKEEMMTENNMKLNAKTVQLQRSLKPKFPFVFEVTANGTMRLKNICLYHLVDASKRMYNNIPIIMNVEGR